MNTYTPNTRTVLHAGRFLALVKEGHWEYVDRVNARGAVIIIAITQEQKLLLVEQYRIPVHGRTIELPAGIVGDEPGGGDEMHIEAARRELLEETGFEGERIETLFTGPACSGLASEMATVVRASGLRRVAAGGGVAHEDIIVHEVPLADAHEWLEAKARSGVLIDPKVYAGLYLAGKEQSQRTAVLSLGDRVRGGLWGALVGDALGVPVEFQGRATVQANPVTDMRGYGTHHQPPGTWSDDGALLLCTVDSLIGSAFDTRDMGERFVRWMKDGLWTATGSVFDIGLATGAALRRIDNGTLAEKAGGRDEHSNGNGSLMRILPVALRFAAESTETLIEHLARASAITHGHERSKMACAFYGLAIRQLLHGSKPQAALDAARTEFTGLFERSAEFIHFRRVLQDDLRNLPEREVESSGYVIHTLHASLWCLLTTSDYRECVLKAVNLGGDTDTTGCVAGGLAGVGYGLGAIPETWRHSLGRHAEVSRVIDRFVTLV